MSSKISRKGHSSLGKGMGSLLGNFDYNSTDEIFSKLESVQAEAQDRLHDKKIEVKTVEIPQEPVVTVVQTPAEDQVHHVRLDDIEPNPDQPRKSFDEAGLEELADSIRKQGIIQPLLVEERSPGKYVIIAGERRYRAARLAGQETVPVLVKKLTEIQRIEMALIENIQRQDLNPVEEAVAYQFLIQKSGFTQDELAKRLGKNRTTITNSLRLLQLPDSMKDDLISGLLTPGHARAILSCVNPADRILLRNKIVEKELSVRAAEAEAQALNEGKKLILKKKGGGKEKEPEIQDVEDKFLEAFGTRVELKGSLRRGRLVIPFRTTKELERLYSLLKTDPLFGSEE